MATASDDWFLSRMLPVRRREDHFAPLIDAHVHLVGKGTHGTGCRYPNHGRYRWLVPLLVRAFGLRSSALRRRDFDQLYARQLTEYIEQSSLDAAVVLALDAPRREDGSVITEADSFYVPNDAVLALAAREPTVLPGVSIHPGRADALDELDRCLESGAALLKLIPACQLIDLLDPKYEAFWGRLADAGLPLLVHTGPEPALEELRPELGEFSRLEGPLRAGVTVIAAHCGGGVFQDQFVEALARYPRLFGDTAAFTMPFSRRRLRPLLEDAVADRLIHGSDVPAPVSGIAWWLRGELSWREMGRCARCANPLQKDLLIKQAWGFPPSVFRRAADVLRPAALEKIRGRPEWV